MSKRFEMTFDELLKLAEAMGGTKFALVKAAPFVSDPALQNLIREQIRVCQIQFILLLCIAFPDAKHGE